MFDNYFDKFVNERGFNRSYPREISISKEKYEKLMEFAEKYELLAAEHKKIKSQNDTLLKELDDLKNDARRFKEFQEEKEKYFNSLLRVRADFENYKKFSERENAKYRSYFLEKILRKLIKHYEDLVRTKKALSTLEDGEHVKKGFEMVVKNFEKILEEEEVKAMNCEGEKFNPNFHEAILVEERDNLPENTILEELDKGYLYKQVCLRPAKVKIVKKI